MTDVSPKLDQPAARASSSGRSPPANGIGQLQRLLEAGATDDIDQPAALVTAMRIAFEATLAHFDPDLLQDEFERHLSKGSILGAPAKLRYWELYQDRYAQMVKQADSTFLQLFAKAFAKAYEEECERQRTVGES